jgi:DNA-binding NarL/FixJ family response regulator
MSDRLRVLLAEDHTIVREGLRALLDAREDMLVVGEVADGQAAVEAAKRLRPDVIVMDLGLPKLNGVDATVEIKGQLPETKVLVLSMYSGAEYVRPAIRAGASGYLLKGSGLSDLIRAIQSVAAGDAFFSPGVAKILLEDRDKPPEEKKKSPADALTKREREVLTLVGQGKTTPEIAEELNLSPKTIEGHRSRIMAKLDLRNVAGMVRAAIRFGFVSTDH